MTTKRIIERTHFYRNVSTQDTTSTTMNTFFEQLHTHLANATHQSFEETSTHYLTVWTAVFDVPNKGQNTYPVAMYTLFHTLSNNHPLLTHQTLLQQGCPSNTLANAIVTALHPSAMEIDYKAFATRLAVLPHTHIKALLKASTSICADANLTAPHQPPMLSVSDTLHRHSNTTTPKKNTHESGGRTVRVYVVYPFLYRNVQNGIKMSVCLFTE